MDISPVGVVAYTLLGMMFALLIYEVIRSAFGVYNMRRERRKLKELLWKEPKHVNLFVSTPKDKGKIGADLSARSGKHNDCKSDK